MSCYRIVVLAEKARTPVSVACELLGVSTSGFYAWASRAPSDRALSDVWLIERIKTVHRENRDVHVGNDTQRGGSATTDQSFGYVRWGHPGRE